MPSRNYIFYEFTRSLCNVCKETIDAKILIENDKVIMQKYCKNHWLQRTLISDDVNYYKMQKEYLKPWDIPNSFNTEIKEWCPHDCWLCPDHEQHSCLSIVEITDKCNMECPICYANSDFKWKHKSLEDIEKMFDVICENETEPDIVQISGWEPTIHPDFFEILDRAKKRPFRYIMINTNGIKIATDEEFVKKLSSYKPNFEIYLQFDSLNDEYLKEIRWQYMNDIRKKALENLSKYNLSTSLVVVLKKWKNDTEIWKIIEFALTQKCVRWITFQVVQSTWRYENYDPVKDRLTISEVRKSIMDQLSYFTPNDIVPLPCHPEWIAMAYSIKTPEWKLMPLWRFIEKDELLSWAENNIMFEHNEEFRKHFLKLFSLSTVWESSANCFWSLLCCLPKIKLSQKLTYDNVFRIMIIQFLDVYNFDLKSVKRSCIHFAKEDWKIYPFDTYNLFYRK